MHGYLFKLHIIQEIMKELPPSSITNLNDHHITGLVEVYRE